MPPQNPGELTSGKLAELLTRSGTKVVTESMIDQDIDAGAPLSPNGRIALFPYIAWLHQRALDGA